jgi:hypothetical protein
MVCWLLTPSLLTVSVADSFTPPPWRGVNLKMIVQLDPLAINKLLAHVPRPVLEKSEALAPVIVK